MAWQDITVGDDVVDAALRKRFTQALVNRDNALRTHPFRMNLSESSTASTAFIEVTSARIDLFIPDWVVKIIYNILVKIANAETASVRLEIFEGVVQGTVGATLTTTSASYVILSPEVTPAVGEKNVIRRIELFRKTSNAGDPIFTKTETDNMGNRFTT